MATLYHHPLCPHSRFVRLALGEYGLEPELIEERAFERRREFLLLDPAGQTPVLVETSGLVAPGAAILKQGRAHGALARDVGQDDDVGLAFALAAFALQHAVDGDAVLGQHTGEVLADLLGYDEARIAALAQSGSIGMRKA